MMRVPATPAVPSEGRLRTPSTPGQTPPVNETETETIPLDRVDADFRPGHRA
ncbi:hypothetical protein OG535_36010 [Kitasatospora sp. NBC_00085]|uniref:hypothetical protein n=1 Tax=unclassified Kitasatospora TaxID=2633591 RepID=UPI003252F7C2